MYSRAMCEVIEQCASLYGFDSSDAKARLSLCVSSSSSSSKLKVKSSSSSSSLVVRSAFALPYSGGAVSSNCMSLKQNSGLYTQCSEVAESSSGMCKCCDTKASKNGGVSPYGTIAERNAVGIMEFKDPKGRSPVAYSKLMQKLGLSEDAVVAEAKRMGVVVDAIHFLAPEMKRGRPKKEDAEPKVKLAKGRPRKQKKVTELACDADDLFMQLVEESNNEEIIAPVPVVVEKAEVASESGSESDSDKSVEKALKAQVKAQAKAEEKALKEQAKADEKAVNEQAKVDEKAAKEQAKADEKAEKEQAKLAKEQAKADEKAEKEQAKLAKEQAKADEKAEKEQAKAEKEQAKAVKDQAKLAKEQAKVSEPVADEKVAVAVAEEEDVVKKFEHGGVKYLKSKKTGIVYNMDQDAIGRWNEQTQKIEFSEESDEESEEEYE